VVENQLKGGWGMLIKEYMTPDPITVEESVSIMEAADLMKKRRVRRFPVVRGKEFVGIVTDRDLRSAAPSQVITFDAYERQLMPELYDLLAKIRVKDIMCRKVITVGPEQTIVMAAHLMLRHRISGLPVMDSGGKLVGIITEGDIFKALVDFSGARLGRTLLVFRLEDRPGSIKGVADVIRAHDGRLASILTSYTPADPEFRRVYIRIRDLPPEKLQVLQEALEAQCGVLQVIQEDLSPGELL
jgi:acetoin utilization protein AcuB